MTELAWMMDVSRYITSDNQYLVFRFTKVGVESVKGSRLQALHQIELLPIYIELSGSKAFSLRPIIDARKIKTTTIRGVAPGYTTSSHYPCAPEKRALHAFRV